MPSKLQKFARNARLNRKTSVGDDKTQTTLSSYFSKTRTNTRGAACSTTLLADSTLKLDSNREETSKETRQPISPAKKRRKVCDDSEHAGSSITSFSEADVSCAQSRSKEKLKIFTSTYDQSEECNSSQKGTSSSDGEHARRLRTSTPGNGEGSCSKGTIVKHNTAAGAESAGIKIPSLPSSSSTSQTEAMVKELCVENTRNNDTVVNKKAGKLTDKNKKTPESKPVVKYTPLEQQYRELRDKYPSAVLLVECGYKYRFFGNDAKIAEKVLKIFAHQDHNFLTASIPVHRLHVHLRRLVAAGHKVGVVQQTETSALKAAGTNKNTPFTRKLTAMYTRSTMIGQEFGSSVENEDTTDMVTRETGYLMCVCDRQIKSEKRMQIGMLAVQPSTGDVIYDSFEDMATRSELETRLSVIQPVEILVPCTVSMETKNLLKSFCDASCEVDKIRFEELADEIFCTTLQRSPWHMLSAFFKSHINSSDVLQQVITLPDLTKCCLAAVVHYLTDFSLQHILYNVSDYLPFADSGKGMMTLDTCVLRNLELFRNSTDGGEKGSLFSVVNFTVTKPGARLLRAWLAHPLSSYSEIQARQEAVQDLLNGCYGDLEHWRALFSRTPDLEQKLTAAYHKKCTPCDFYNLCKVLQSLAEKIHAKAASGNSRVKSSLLEDVVTQIPLLLNDVDSLISSLNVEAAKDNNKRNLISDEKRFPKIAECIEKIGSITKELDVHKREIRLTIGQPAFDYTTVLGTEYLVEVRNAHMNLVPRDWTKLSSTKSVSRFHTPLIVEKFKQLQQARERLDIEADQAWIAFLDGFSACYWRYKKAVKLLSTFDCLLSLGALAGQDGYTRPELVKDELCIDIQDGCNPIVKHLLSEIQQFVPNSTNLTVSGERVHVISGPNMGGKSCYIRQVALTCILAQIGAHVPASSARLGVLDAIYNRMGASDDLHGGRSTFMVELQETSDILNKVTPRSLVILDELGRGTSTHDGVAIAYATLKHFVEKVGCLTLYVTHYPLLAEFEALYPGVVANYHMSFYVHDQRSRDDMASTAPDTSLVSEEISFLYQLVRGQAARSYGVNVARLAGMPSAVIDQAVVMSHHMEDDEHATRRRHAVFHFLFSTDDVRSAFQALQSLPSIQTLNNLHESSEK